MKEIRERLARLENGFWLYAGCALDLNRNVDLALARAWQKLLNAKCEAEMPDNDRIASKAFNQFQIAFSDARKSWGI